MFEKWRNRITVMVTAVFIFGFAFANLIKPHSEYSEAERRKLASFPTVSAERVWSGRFMKEFDDYAADQFPLRESFRSLNAFMTFEIFRQKDSNGVYRYDGMLSAIEYPMNEKSLKNAAGRIEEIYAEYLEGTGCRSYMCIVPDKNAFMARPGGYPSMDYEKFCTQMEELVPDCSAVRITDMLQKEDYYNTDTHWRQEKITDIAAFLASLMKGEQTEDIEYTVYSVDNEFRGVYSGRYALEFPGEPLNYLKSRLIDACTVYDYETESFIDMYDMEKAAGKDPYEMFLSGSKSLLTIENPEAETDRELVLFRDSFGSSMGILLAQYYSRVTLVDTRYLPASRIGRFLEFNDQDVLFMYSTLVLNNSIAFK